MTDIARTHLDADVADRWLTLLKPAIRLVQADESDAVVARLGGRPVVPSGFEWPVWEGAGPLSFIGEVDLDAVAATDLDPGIDLPQRGRLLAFYFDGAYNDFESVVSTWHRESLAGARLIHLMEPRSDGEPLSAPDRVEEFRGQSLSGRQIATHPGWDHHLSQSLFGAEDWDYQTWLRHPIAGEDFQDALYDAGDLGGPRHQIGGWADAEQGPVELDVAEAGLNDDVPHSSPAHLAEAAAWHLLLQVDSDYDNGMMWGDVGLLYWLRRDSDRAPSDLGRTSFTWQCG